MVGVILFTCRKEVIMARETWEISASMARNVAEGAPLRKLKKTKKRICEEITQYANQGEREMLIDFCYYEVSCLEDWCNIFNWLKRLGYTVVDYSGRKINPCFVVKW
jgi:hypothetical protein